MHKDILIKKKKGLFTNIGYFSQRAFSHADNSGFIYKQTQIFPQMTNQCCVV